MMMMVIDVVFDLATKRIDLDSRFTYCPQLAEEVIQKGEYVL